MLRRTSHPAGLRSERAERLQRAWSVLLIPNFRRFVTAYAALITAISVQRTVLAWTMLEISGDVALVGIAVMMQFAPVLVFSLAAGAVADRWAKKRVVLACQSCYIAIAGGAILLVSLGMLTPGAIVAVGFAIGTVQAFQQPAAHGIVSEMVEPARLTAGVSFTSSAFQTGQVVGPALGGVVLAELGSVPTWGLAIVALSLSFVLLLRVDAARLNRARREPGQRTSISGGLGYLAKRPDFVITLTLILVISLSVYATPVILSSFANDEFRIGSAGYGMLNSVLALGAVLGALVSAQRPAPTLPRLLLLVCALGASQIVVSLSPVLWLFCVALALRGVISLLTTTAADAFLQLNTDPLMRGRVLSVYGMTMNTGMALGNLLMGGLIAQFGVRPVLLVASALPVLLAASILVARRTRGGIAGSA